MAGRGRPKGQSNAERETMSSVRLAQVEDALLAGRSHGWCLERFAKEWDVTERQVQNYIARVEQRWRETAPTATPELRQVARERVLMFFRSAMADRSEVPGAYGAAARALDMLHKLDGTYEPVKVEHSGGIDVSALTPAQQDARIEELLKRRITD